MGPWRVGVGVALLKDGQPCGGHAGSQRLCEPLQGKAPARLLDDDDDDDDGSGGGSGGYVSSGSGGGGAGSNTKNPLNAVTNAFPASRALRGLSGGNSGALVPAAAAAVAGGGGRPKVLDPSAYALSETLSVKNDGTKMDNCFSFRVGERLVELCMSVDQLPGAFERSKLVVLRNRYCVVNAMADETLLVRQEGTPDEPNYVLEVPPLGKAFFHWSNADKQQQRMLVRFKKASCWALGGFGIDAVGGVGVWLPPLGSSSSLTDARSFVTAHVEVRLADDTDDSAMNVVVWRDDGPAAGCLSAEALALELNGHRSFVESIGSSSGSSSKNGGDSDSGAAGSVLSRPRNDPHGPRARRVPGRGGDRLGRGYYCDRRGHRRGVLVVLLLV